MAKCHWVGVGLTVIGVLVVVQSRTTGDDPSKSALYPQEFDGKILVINHKQTSQLGSAILKEVRKQQLGGRAFLVGRYASEVHSEGAAWDGVKVWVPVDEVITLIEVASVEQARKMTVGAYRVIEKSKERPQPPLPDDADEVPVPPPRVR